MKSTNTRVIIASLGGQEEKIEAQKSKVESEQELSEQELKDKDAYSEIFKRNDKARAEWTRKTCDVESEQELKDKDAYNEIFERNAKARTEWTRKTYSDLSESIQNEPSNVGYKR